MRNPALPEIAAFMNPTEVHVCDNYLHLLYASADLAGRTTGNGGIRQLIVFIDDRLPLHDELRERLSKITDADILTVSDQAAIESFSRLPRIAPPMLRRNLSWTDRGRPILPSSWTPPFLGEECFDLGYVYHPGFFLSKVVAGRCSRVVMRDSGYANYVRHRVPLRRKLPRLLAGRSPRYQTWGEEPWIDEIEVVRPDRLPSQVRHKARRQTLDSLMSSLPPERSAALARAFWGPNPMPELPDPSATALLLTQPIDVLGFHTADEARALYSSIADRLAAMGYDVVVKPHPLQRLPLLEGMPTIAAGFPIEAWTWLEQPEFAVAVSLNSTALSDSKAPFAHARIQLVPADRFYRRHRNEWPGLIDKALDRWGRSSATQAQSDRLEDPCELPD